MLEASNEKFLFEKREWRVAHDREISLGPAAVIMAIVNVTPDSFSDGGRYERIDLAIDRALTAVSEGASIVDIGGESTRPDAVPVEAAEEQARVLPVIEALRTQTDALISIDTYRAETARLAIGAGAHIANDVFGLQREPEMAEVAANTGAGLCIMHTGREREKLPDVIEDQYSFFRKSLEIAVDAGVAQAQIVLDPGFGFGKDIAENVELMGRLEELHAFRFPLMIGTSRKRFLGALTGRDAPNRDAATAAANVLMRASGAAIFRVHDVVFNKDALNVVDAVIEAMLKKGIT